MVQGLLEEARFSICLECRAEFETNSPVKKFCTTDCTNRYHARKYYENNRDRVLERNANYTARHPTVLRENNLKRNYGITLEDYNVMFDNQNGCCAICGIHQSNLKKSLHVDHNHTTGEIRGLLCQKCNHAIGLLNDDPSIISAALEYIS